MALQVWLPLNKEGDFQNKGLADITVKGSPEYDLNGKIGGCYKNYSGKYLTISHNISDTTEFSFTYWINIPSTITQAKAWQWFMTFSGKSNDVLSNAVVTWTDYNQLKLYDSTGWDQKLWQSFSYDTWYHISVVHTSGNFKIYINGELESRNYNTSSILKLTAGNIIIGSGLNSTYSKVKFNDFRVYNHCLSPKEVKEIFKGLVLHYPLNNIISNTIYDCSGYCNNGTITGSLITSNNTPRYDKCTVFNTHEWIKSSYVPKMQEEFTCSWWFTIKNPYGERQGVMLSNYAGDNAGSFIEIEVLNGYLRIHFSDEIKNTKSWIPVKLIANKQYFLGLTYKNHTFTLYLYYDGQQHKYTQTYPDFNLIHSSYSYVNIGSMSQSINGINFNGTLSDLRIYHTALSDDDIKELYNTSVLIDNQQNLSAYSFNETSENNISKSGILNSNQFIEDSNAEIYEDKTKANQIIEI